MTPEAIHEVANLIAEAGATASKQGLEQIVAQFRAEMTELQHEHEAGLAAIRQQLDQVTRTGLGR